MAIDSTKDKLFERQARLCRYLDKYVSDRVWSDPQLECRITTRPSILNQGAPGDNNAEPVSSPDFEPTGSVTTAVNTYKAPFVPLNGVLYGSFEQIALPRSGGPFFVYSVDLHQLPSLKLDATSWILLQDYCNTHIVSFRVHTGDGLCLPRGKMYIRQSDHAETILLAINADIFDTFYRKTQKCDRELLDGTRPHENGWDPTDIYVTTYVESDMTTTSSGLEVREPDNVIETHDVSGFDIINRDRARITPVPKGKTFVFWNGNLLVTDGDASYLDEFKAGDVLEYVTDVDVVTKLLINRVSAPALTITKDGETASYTVVHTPIALNPRKYLISYEMCDFFISPVAVTEAAKNKGAGIYTTSRYIRQSDMEALMEKYNVKGKLFSQLTFNDFCINRDLLDALALEMGCAEEDGVPQYILKVFVRHHTKKLGLVRDFNYCDMLYSRVMSDADILGFLTKNKEAGESDAEAMWYGESLFDSYYGQLMNEQILPECRQNEDIANQCANCRAKINGYCKCLAHFNDTFDEHGNVTGHGAYLEALTSTKCAYFTKRNLKDYIDILGYYNTMQLICKRVSTYKVVAPASRKTLIDLRTDPSAPVVPMPEYSNYDYKHNIPVQVPIVYNDLVVSGTNTIDASKFRAIVYLNGIKLDSNKVTVGPGYGNYNGFKKILFSVTPRPIDDMWCEERKFLNIRIADDVVVNIDDYFVIELIVAESASSVGHYTMEFDVKSRYFDPIGASSTTATNVSATATYTGEGDDKEINIIAGSEVAEGSVASRVYKWRDADYHYPSITGKSTDIIYLNGRHLVAGIDYTPLSVADAPIIQNISYLKENDNTAELIATDETTISVSKGFQVGNTINWQEEGVMWFDGLSILVVDGQVQYKFIFNQKEIDLSACAVKNGSPYMVRTTVPKDVITLFDLICGDASSNRVTANADWAKFLWMHEYFETKIEDVPTRAILTGEHAIYSTYLLAIIKAIVVEDFDFEMLEDPTEFAAQFSSFASVKAKDVAYQSLTAEDLRFVDVYPVYYNPTLNDREKRRKINYMVRMLMPSDQIRHVEHVNV